MLDALQEASNILVTPILKLLGLQGCISDRHRYQFKTIASKNVTLVTL